MRHAGSTAVVWFRRMVVGDAASNAGGWQCAAATGTDPPPWFRVFNPLRQARRFDPDGAYVRRWVPELAARPELPGGDVHPPPSDMYLPPIIDLAFGRSRTLETYQAAQVRHRAASVGGLASPQA